MACPTGLNDRNGRRASACGEIPALQDGNGRRGIRECPALQDGNGRRGTRECPSLQLTAWQRGERLAGRRRQARAREME
jgi:hypothetical protein